MVRFHSARSILLRLTVLLALLVVMFRIMLPTLARMSSTSFVIQMGNLNMTSGEKSSGTYTITDTVGQTAPGQYSSAGYYVKAGFQYIYTIGTFSFSISNTAVNLGTLTTNQFSTGTTVLTVSAKGAGGYIVTASENNRLRTANQANNIPDTTCDSGTCTETTAAVWSTATNNGFGYNMTGNDIPAAFASSTYFKQFADQSLFESAQTIMSNTGVGKNRQATVTYKVSISGTQAAGLYENAITYIATPGY